MSYMYSDLIRRHVTFLVFFNISLIIVGLILLFVDLSQFNIILIVILTIVNTLVIFKLIKYIYNELHSLSHLVSKAINGNHKFDKNDYSEGIISGIKLQFANLFSRIDRTNNKLVLEKEKMSKLVTELSHQIKTPISSIKLFNSLLNDNIDQNDRVNIINKMRLETEKLEWFSKVLLDISKLETGLINLDIKELSIEEVITEAIGTVYAKSKKKNIEIKGDILDFSVNIDKKWTKEAIINILDNAIKYTNSGGLISIHTKKLHASNRIFITDNGRGIYKEDIPHIFNRFFKGKNAKTEEGTGIGLYLAKEIIEMQNGTIKVSTKINEGTTFEIVFYK